MNRRSSHGPLAWMAALGTAVAALAGLSTLPADAQRSAATHVTSISIARDGDVMVVSIEGDGPLPVPEAGTATNPARIFFDFPGLSPKTRGSAAPANPLLRRVRAALNNAAPRVTRVVLDLTGEVPFQIDRSGLPAGRLTVRVGAEPVPPSPQPNQGGPPARIPVKDPEPEKTMSAVPVVPPVPAEPPAVTSPPIGSTGRAATPPSEPVPPPPVPKPAGPPAKPANAPPASEPGEQAGARRDGDRYRQQVGDALDRARDLRAVLSAIDRLAPQQTDTLERAVTEFDGIRRSLSVLKVPDALRSTHDMVLRACTLGGMAAALRAQAGRTGDEAALRNAASAAAGALLLLDRACIELGCTAPR